MYSEFMQRLFIFLATLLALATSISAQTTWYVDQSGNGDFLTIQEGIDASSNGDTVIVRDGVYPEFIQLNGRAITLKSENGPASTEITGVSPYGNVLSIQNGEGRDTVVQGFRIPGGAGTQGVYVQFSSPTLDSLEISGHSGRGLQFEDANPLLLNILVESNTGGGLIATKSSIDLTGCDFRSNSVSNASGGALFITGGSIHMDSCILESNSSTAQGGALRVRNGACFLESCAFTSNQASDQGGAVSFEEDTLGPGITILNCTFDLNDANYGGAVRIDSPSLSSIQSSTFNGNTGRYDGGAVHTGNGTTITACSFLDNGPRTSSYSIEGAAVKANQITILDTVFSSNGDPSNVYGGAVYCQAPSVIDGSSFLDNLAFNGGAIFFYSAGSAALEIEDSIFLRNGARDRSTAIFSSGSSSTSVQVLNSVVASSVNLGSASGALMSEGPGLELTGCTIAFNHAFGTVRSFTMKNSIAWGNNGFVPLGKDVSFSCVESGYPGIGNTPYDPLLTTGPQGGYYLSQMTAGQMADSSCLDAGDPATQPVFGTTRTDEVLDQGRADIGYHYPIAPPPPPIDTDGDGIFDDDEINVSFTDPNDDDTDDDGLSDGEEFYFNSPKTDPNKFDSDGDTLGDGLEMGMDQVNRLNGTDPGVFVPDADPGSTTSPVKKDTDTGGNWDSVEDSNLNGRREFLETDPNLSGDDILIGDIETSVPQVSVINGGIAELYIDFASKYRNERFLVLGSLTGASTGFRLGRVHVPIDFDFLTASLLTGNYYPQMVNFDSQLDSIGDALALVVLAPGSSSSLIGRTLYWSAIVVPPHGYPLSVTDVAVLQLVQ